MTVSTRLTVGQLCAEPGSKARGAVRVDVGGTAVEVPVTLVNGVSAGPRVLMTGGVHGGEFIGVDAATRLAAELDPRKIRGHVVICPIANPPAVYEGRFDVSPRDGVNMNRVFPGDPDGGPTERLAAWLFENLVAGADAYADLHSGGIDEVLCDFVGYRVVGDAGLDGKARAMAHAVGYPDVVFSRSADGGNSHAAAARRGVPAILIETGERGERGEPATGRLMDGLHRLLDHLGLLDTAPAAASTSREWIWASSVEAPVGGLWYPDFARGSDVSVGQTIGRIIDPADGRERKVTTTATGRIFYGMHALTVAPGDELAAIAAPAATGPDARTR